MALPAVAEPHRTYLDRASELQGSHPLVALQCRLMLLQLGMKLRQDQQNILPELAAMELKQWLLTTMEECETARARLFENSGPEEAKAALRAFGLNLLSRARHADRPDLHPSPALAWTLNEAPLVAKCFHAGAVILDCLKLHEPRLPPDLLQAQLAAHTRSRSLARALSASLRSAPCIPLEWEPVPPHALPACSPAEAAAPPLPPRPPPPPSEAPGPLAGAAAALGAALAGLGASAPSGAATAGGAGPVASVKGAATAPSAAPAAASAAIAPASSSSWADKAKTAGAAATVGGVAVGAALGSAVLGVAAAGATAHAALAKNDGAGEAARGTGRAAVAAMDKAREIDGEYALTARTAQAAQAGYESLVAFEKEHAVGERVAAAAQATAAKAKQLDEEYQLADKAGAAARAVGQAASSGLDALLGWMSAGPAKAPDDHGGRKQ